MIAFSAAGGDEHITKGDEKGVAGLLPGCR
jgi:hypothetical protein